MGRLLPGTVLKHRFSFHRSLIVALLAFALLAGGCKVVRHAAARYPRPDLGSIYHRSARNAERNPVLLIPGFAGSTLVRERDGKKVWGAFFTDDTLGYAKRDGMRAFALDLETLPERFDYRDLARIDDDAIAVALLEHVETDAIVADVNFKVYASLVDLLEGAGYVARSPVDPRKPLDGGTPYFTFYYDWRQDNVSNAVALGRFIEQARHQLEVERPDSKPVRFDVVAHSMGGLVARYYLRYGAADVLADPEAAVTWAGASDVDRLILVSTPSFGTMKILRDMVYGRPHPVIATVQSSMLASWVSSYQMLPREHHPLWIDENGRPVETKLYSAEVWRANQWGPFAPDQDKYLSWLFPGIASAVQRSERMEDFMDAAFERARRFAAALDRYPGDPCPATLVLFAGDAEPTLERAIVTRRDGRPVLEFEGPDALGLQAPGDGTVSRSSALADERLARNRRGWLTSPVPWDWTIFISDRHATFLGNPTFQNNLLHLLIETPPRSAAKG
jgi:pimeloyl-ACP methyl ester carboxylesterase